MQVLFLIDIGRMVLAGETRLFPRAFGVIGAEHFCIKLKIGCLLIIIFKRRQAFK